MDRHPIRPVPTQRPVLPRLALVAASVLAGLLASGALLAAVGALVPEALAAPASGAVIYPGGAGCTTTLQACIDNSPAGTTIQIQPNTYFTTELTLSKPVSLTGVSSATVILNALSNQRVLTVTDPSVDSSVVISGLTLSGGHAAGAGCPDGCGGAIYISGLAHPKLVNLTIENNIADGNGGGGAIYAEAGSPLTLLGVAVLSNTATNGHAGGVFAIDDDVIVNGSVFRNNLCQPGLCWGGGLAVFDNLTVTHVTVDSSIFVSNTSGRGGGGVYAQGFMTALGGRFESNHCLSAGACSGGGLNIIGTLFLSGTQVLSNTSASDGGGARATIANLTGVVFRNNQGGDSIGGGLSADAFLVATDTQFISNATTFGAGGAYAGLAITLTRGLFQDNQCTGLSCKGGGLWAGGTMALTNTQFLNNRGQQGGGLYQGGANAGDGRLVNNLFGGNFADDNGQALFLVSPGQVTLLHTTIASPTLNSGSAVFVGGGTVNLTDTLLANYAVGIENSSAVAFEDYSLFSGVSTPHGGLVGGGTHSHPGAAGFADAAHNNYHLAPGSAAIDAGVNAGINFDIDGNPRPIGINFDIGFDEFLNQLFLPLVRK